MEPKYPSIDVQLTGNDGNAFSIMGNVTRAMKRHGIPNSECEAYYAEATSGDYDNLLRVTTQWVNVK